MASSNRHRDAKRADGASPGGPMQFSPRFRKLWQPFVAFAALVSAFVQGPLEPVALAQHGLGAAAALLVVLQVAEVGRCTLAGLWRPNPTWLLAQGGIWCAAMSLTAYVGLSFGASAALTVLCAIPFGLFWWTREGFDRRLAEFVEQARQEGKPPKPLFDWVEIVCPSESDGTLMIAIDLKPRISAALGHMHRVVSVGPRRVAMNVVILAIMMACLMLAVAAAVAMVHVLGGTSAKAPRPEHHDAATASSPAEGKTAVTTGTGPAVAGSLSGVTTTPAKGRTHTEEAVDSWDGRCSPASANSTLVQYEVEIEELYTGNTLSREGLDPRFRVPLSTGEPPGRKEGGCTLEYHKSYIAGFVWAWGEIPDTHRHLSIAVDSAMGPALFLEPAAREVHVLIREHGQVTGIRRFDAGTGDFYPVDVPGIGTYILIRREKGTSAIAGAYEVIPPSIAEIWVSTVDGKGRFLWPRLTRQEGNPVYDFDTNTSTTNVAYTVPYPSSTVAEPQINETELQEAADYAGK